MNRRTLLGVGAGSIFARLLGLGSLLASLNGCAANQAASTAAVAKPSKSQSAKNALSLDKAQSLMAFMLLVSQTGFVDDLFPANGNPNYDKNFTRLGLEPNFMKQFVNNAQNNAHDDELRKLFNTAASLFAAVVVDYSGPDCPNTTKLKEIIVAAKR